MTSMRGFSTIFYVMMALVFTLGCVSGPVSNPETPTLTVSETTPIPSATVPTLTTFPPIPVILPQNISTNWAGYVVETDFVSPKANAIEEVEAVWNIPIVNCTGNGTGNYSSAFWVGIDGFSSASIEQIGTASDCIRGSPSYYAWYEMYPKGSVILDLNLSPGDEVHAKVTYIGNQSFLLSLTDTTSGQNVSVTETSTIAKRSSAEWIAEAPVYRHHILPLSDFGPVDFLNASVTVNGKTGPILSDRWKYRSLVMETSDGVIKATPSKLENGDSFSIIWDHQ